ncbi:MAG: EVE domain-containing protein [Pseudomonadota bacterium]
MAYWLFKSEPNTWSWDDQVAKGAEGEEWDGVRNYQARNNMRQMVVGDLGFFYHSVNEKQIVGIVEVCAEIHADTTTDDPRWECVDIRAVAPVPRPVTLAEMKAEDALAEFALIKQSRLSVVPVSAAEWAHICKMAEYKGPGS